MQKNTGMTLNSRGITHSKVPMILIAEERLGIKKRSVCLTPPRARNEHQRATFIMASRIEKNKRGGSGF
eukprot:380996-Pleurochrysis_carterae.AAC.1